MQIKINYFISDNPFLQNDEEGDHNTDVNIMAGFLNNNPFFQLAANLSQSDKSGYIHNDLKNEHGVNKKFIAETEITELLRSCNIYSSVKSRLDSKNTLRVPNVLFNVNLNRKVPLIIESEYFKFDAASPTMHEIFETEFLEAKYKLEVKQPQFFTPKDVYMLKRYKTNM